MRKAVGSKKALQHLVLAIVLALGVVLSFNYAFAADGSSDGTSTDAVAEENSDSANSEEKSADASSSQDTIEADASNNNEATAEESASNYAVVTAAAAATPTISITNNFAANGTYDATVTNMPDGAKIVWQRSVDNSNWTNVVATKVTGDSYNVDPDATKATSINIALDSKVIGNDSTDTTLYYYRATLVDAAGNQLAVSNSIQNTFYTQLLNGSFENPSMTGDLKHYMKQYPNGSAGLIWKTTGSDGLIEIINTSTSQSWDGGSRSWSTQKQLAQKYHNCGEAVDGVQYAELNAEAAGSLYQDVMTVPGSTLYWQLYHRARPSRGSDTMYVVIMPTSSGKSITTQLQVEDVVANPDNYPGAQVVEISDGDSWVEHSGTYTVPSNQYLTRFFFVAGETASGNNTIGNFLDDVSFSSHVPDPNPNTGNVTVTKTIYGLASSNLSKYKVTVTLTSPSDSNKTYSHTFDSWNAGSDGSYSNSYTFTNVPAGSYNVTESVEGASTNDYTETQTFDKKSVTVTDRSSTSVAITNSYAKKTGTLKISKNVSGSAANTNEDFTFTLTSKDLAGMPFTVTDQKDVADTVTFNSEGVAKITLKHGDTKTISGIPTGTSIAVQETGLSGNAKTSTTVKVNDGYSRTVKAEDSTNSSTDSVTATIVANETQTLAFTNTAQAQPDTGISLNTSSMVGLLSAVGAGAAALGIAVARSKHGERKER